MTDDWEPVLAGLRADGWQAVVTCHAAPVQLEGRTPEGAPFYFWARHNGVYLGIGGKDPVDEADWSCETEVRAGDSYRTSYLTPEQAVGLLRAFHAIREG